MLNAGDKDPYSVVSDLETSAGAASMISITSAGAVSMISQSSQFSDGRKILGVKFEKPNPAGICEIPNS